jgi:hypothetical protein
MTMQATPPDTPARVPLRPARRWVLGIGAVLSLAAILWGVLLMINLLGRTTETTTTTLGSTRPLLVVSSSGGSVKVGGADVRDVRVTTTLQYGLSKPKVTQVADTDGITLDISCPWWSLVCSTSYDIVVPRGFEVRADSSGGSIAARDLTGRLEARSSGGSISADNLSGGVRADSSGGSVTVTGVDGPVDLHSSGGSVTGTDLHGGEATADSSGGGVRLVFAEPPDRVSADSSGGSVTIALPRVEGAYDVDASASGGSSAVSVPTEPTSERKITARSSGGSVRITLAEGG